MRDSSWADRAEDELSNDLSNGVINQKEYNAAIRDLRNEYYEDRQRHAQEAYDNY